MSVKKTPAKLHIPLYEGVKKKKTVNKRERILSMPVIRKMRERLSLVWLETQYANNQLLCKTNSGIC